MNNSNVREVRRRNPTGWLDITDDEDIRFVLDALLDSQPEREESLRNLAKRSGVHEEEILGVAEYLEDLGVLELTGDENYKIKSSKNSGILRSLHNLNASINGERLKD